MFIAALFTITRTWKHPKKIWYIYTMGYYSAIKKTQKNETIPFAVTWMDLRIVVLSEVGQIEKDKYYILSFMSGI